MAIFCELFCDIMNMGDDMKKVDVSKITKEVKKLVLDANYHIGQDFLSLLAKAKDSETSEIGKHVLDTIIENDQIASKERMPMCQDTGMVVCFLDIGYDVHLNGDVYDAVNQGVREAYQEGFLRKSVAKHPIDRGNTQDNTPAIIHVKLVPGDQIKITVAPKGGGAENMSLVKMLISADGIDGVKKLVLKTIFESGGKPCPPLVVGIGLGGNLEKSALLAKEALMRDLDDESPDPTIRQLEKDLLNDINRLGVGPMGFGGNVTALAVKINSFPCHIASLPVAINLQCHASRHKTGIIS